MATHEEPADVALASASRASDSRSLRQQPSKARGYDPVALARSIDVPTCNCDWVFDADRVDVTFDEVRAMEPEFQFLAILKALIPCPHVEAAEEAFQTRFAGRVQKRDEFKVLMKILLEAFPSGDDCIRLRAEPPAEMATSAKARLGMYARRFRRGQELFRPGDSVKHRAVAIDADAGDGPLSKQSKDGVRRDRVVVHEDEERDKWDCGVFSEFAIAAAKKVPPPGDMLDEQLADRRRRVEACLAGQPHHLTAEPAEWERQGEGECEWQNTPLK